MSDQSFKDPRLFPQPVTPPRFDIDDPKALEYLQKEGYVVFKNVLSEEEIKTGINLMWQWLKHISPSLKRNDPNSWDSWPKSFSNGIMFSDGIGQSEFMWYLRGRPKVIQVYSQIWGTKDLLTSFDGCSILRPPDFNSDWKTSSLGLHMDQNLKLLPGFQCVQGGLNLLDSDPDDGGFVCVPRSHLVTQDLWTLEQYDKMRTHIIGFPMDSTKEPWTNILKDYHSVIKVCVKAGDFVLWDSRTIHGNFSPSFVKDSASPKFRSIRRIVAFICMLPTSKVQDQTVFEKRRMAVKQGVTTSHWPIEYHPRKALPSNFVPPQLNLTQQALVAPN